MYSYVYTEIHIYIYIYKCSSRISYSFAAFWKSHINHIFQSRISQERIVILNLDAMLVMPVV